MAELLNILCFPDPRLHNKAEAIVKLDDEIRQLVDDMFTTMYAAPGIGLAATQVNVPKRVVVIDISEDKDAPLCLINPEVLERDGTTETEEGCLSVPGVYDTVERAERIQVQALDREGTPFKLDADGLLAVCIQHEIDHLDGILFIEHLSQLKRRRLKKKAEKLNRQTL